MDKEVSVDGTNLVANSGFEDLVSEGGDMPPHWYIASAEEGDRWTLDQAIKSEGDQSLRFEPVKHCVAYQDVLSPTEEMPVHDLKGKTISFSVDIRKEGDLTPVAQLIGYNPNLPEHPDLRTGAAGMTQAVAIGGPEGQFRTYKGEFVPTGEITTLQLVLTAAGSDGRVWFDRAVVEIKKSE